MAVSRRSAKLVDKELRMVGEVQAGTPTVAETALTAPEEVEANLIQPLARQVSRV